ncbi:MAG: phenylalanine--tRNA ligase subunit alpha [Candidatus Paceibacterota bacterium]|jgi:phenylalanyl-tRNA synthetase alpha chain
MEENKGHLHPITILTDKITQIFTEMGFDVADGPELENEWNNFDALNVPRNHPSRDMQDTFWLKPESLVRPTAEGGLGIKRESVDRLGRPMGHVLRTQTSPIQIREMEKWALLTELEKKANPLAIVAPGKVFRNEATDATHEAQFHQVEGLLVGEGVSLANLKAVLETFFSKLFEKDTTIRMRSSFFPFVEPGVEFDMQCFKCGGAGCNVCKQTGWIEIGGAGMVHPNVLNNCGINNRNYQGFAFGCGMDRLAMLKWGIDDVRLLYNGDLRVVSQF